MLTSRFQLLWQFGEKQYNAQQWLLAADWYRLATHDAFQAMAEASAAKCLRKAALCYIEAKDMQRAAQTIQNCSQDEAATHYVHFLTYAYQGESA